ncbi:MAG: iron ABC transporter permease [Prevotella sp.]|nr:iron ABC transporter permease [Prevotella sp.]MDY2633586.1 iron ABC transporter permease [Prevotella sp.]
MSKGTRYCIFLALLTGIFFVLNLFFGTVKIPVGEIVGILSGRPSSNDGWQYIIMESRLPQAVTAVLCGSSLAVSGLLLQTAFKNPLAGPSIFGINSGAGLGVALVILLFGGSLGVGSLDISGFLAVLVAAFAGAMAVMLIIFIFSSMVRNNIMLLIIGIMIGYLASSAIALLNFFATDEGVKSYLVWGLGSFAGVTMSHLPIFALFTISGLAAAVGLIKPLNALLLGEQYAENLGIRTIAVRNRLLLITGLLTAVTTAFCGPVAFIGLAVPHLARLLLSTENHRWLLPATIIMGALVALVCNLVCYLPGEYSVIPLNAVTPVMGAPVIIYVIISHKHTSA